MNGIAGCIAGNSLLRYSIFSAEKIDCRATIVAQSPSIRIVRRERPTIAIVTFLMYDGLHGIPEKAAGRR
jgi:hypothetical protein